MSENQPPFLENLVARATNIFKSTKINESGYPMDLFEASKIAINELSTDPCIVFADIKRTATITPQSLPEDIPMLDNPQDFNSWDEVCLHLGKELVSYEIRSRSKELDDEEVTRWGLF